MLRGLVFFASLIDGLEGGKLRCSYLVVAQMGWIAWMGLGLEEQVVLPCRYGETNGSGDRQTGREMTSVLNDDVGSRTERTHTERYRTR